jgi:hypothetical protein
MRVLNEYQQRDELAYSISAEQLQEIVFELNSCDESIQWTMVPRDNQFEFTPSYIYIQAVVDGHTLQIMARRGGYGNVGRWDFQASGWPTYKDSMGRTESVYPSRVYNPRGLTQPSTTAAETRPAKAIARQIHSKIVGDYVDTYKICAGVAEANAVSYDKERAARERVADACQDEREFRGQPQRTFYIKGAGLTGRRVEFRSANDIQMTLTADEAVEVIAMLRARGES